jgi:ABC-2 type transport system permease protein
MSLMDTLLSSVGGRQRGEASDMLRLFTEDNIWATTTFFTGFLLYLPGMVIINLFINEVNFKTHRQNIIDGWKRETFIYTKIGLIFCISVVVMIMNLIATFVMCQVTNVPFTFSRLDILAFSFLQSFIYLMFALLLATFFRRSGIAIIVYFLYGLLLEWLLFWLVREVSKEAANFLPLQVADSLIPFPIKGGPYDSIPAVYYVLIGALIYLGLYIYLTTRKYKYDDL